MLVRWAADALRTMAGLFVAIGMLGAVVLIVRLVRHPPARAVGVTARDGALVLAVAVIIVLTLLTPGDTEREPTIRLIPFQDLRDALEGIRDLRLAIAELMGNVLIFIPFAMALRWRFPALGVLQAGLVSMAFSIAIEATQALTGGNRWPESTDVIMNTMGGLIGAALARFGAEPEPQG